MKAPVERGIKRRKENFAAFSLSIPKKSAEEIVMPLRDTPGKSASAWKSPIRVAFFALTFERAFENLVRKRTTPVKINAPPINAVEENVFSIMSLKKNPNSAAGTVAIARYPQSGLYSLLKLKRAAISLLVKTIMARTDERWRAVKKNISGSEIMFERSARCPDEDIGKNSVAACITARIISFSMAYFISSSDITFIPCFLRSSVATPSPFIILPENVPS